MEDIGKVRAAFLRLKQNPVDLILTIKHVGGNREIIYETGEGYTLLADSSKWTHYYVNVWRLQKYGRINWKSIPAAQKIDC